MKNGMVKAVQAMAIDSGVDLDDDTAVKIVKAVCQTYSKALVFAVARKLETLSETELDIVCNEEQDNRIAYMDAKFGRRVARAVDKVLEEAFCAMGNL